MNSYDAIKEKLKSALDLLNNPPGSDCPEIATQVALSAESVVLSCLALLTDKQFVQFCEEESQGGTA